jgi:hypothetical protein
VGLAVGTEGNGAATAARTSDASRLLTRRRNLPSGRAVVGGFLVALAALSAFVAARGTGGGPSHHYVVVAHDVIAGTTLRASDLRTEAVDLPNEMAGRAFTDAAAVIGRITTTALANGELVQASSVVGGDAADPRFQLSVPVERSRALDGSLVAGDEHLADVSGRPVSEREVGSYWHQLVERNRSQLVNPYDADLLFTGQVIDLPAVAPG